MIYGGTGAADPTDGGDSITFSGTGSWGIWGNAGADSIVQGARAFDAATYASVFGGKDGDSITLGNTANRDAHFAIYGGENGPATAAHGGIDSITVVNVGANASTIIFGGQGAADPLDGDDTIAVDGSGGTITIFGNAGNDTISGLGLQNLASATIFGGRGSDGISLSNAEATGRSSLTIYGGEDGDVVSANGNGGNLTIYGGTGQADPTDGADIITLSGINTGTILVMANGGDDVVRIGATGTDAATRVTVFGGGGNDSISVAAQTDGAQKLTLTGNGGADTFTIAKGAGQTITITDFSADGGDTLTITGMGQVVPQASKGSFLTLAQALESAARQAETDKAVVSNFGDDTYVVLTNGAISNPQIITLVGVTDISKALPGIGIV
jgi:Ca2+-binding RTX toxin-like protein